MKKFILSILFTILTIASFSQSANNLCAGSIVASQTGGCVGGAIVAGDADNIAGCAGCQGPNCNNHKDVWYTFVATGNTFLFTLTGGTLVNGEITLIAATGPCAGLTLINSTCGALPLTGTYSGLVTGTTYYILVSAPGNQTGTFTICTTVSTPSGVDCPTATQVCSNASFSGNSSGFGTQELNAGNRGCLSVEHQSSWYVITIATSGTLQMTIVPTGADDYDFAVWGPASTCPPTAVPIRCSWASGNGNTGINSVTNAPQVDNSEGAGGNRWVQDMNVLAGEVYIVLIDNFTASATPFNLNWGGTATISCIPLPIELLSFYGYNKSSYNLLTWETATETNNDYFTLERSIDGINWDVVTIVDGSGNSSFILSYRYKDYDFKTGVNYYRLSQTDYNGHREFFNIIALENKLTENKILKVTNIMGQEVPLDFEGLRIIYYSDGTTTKRVGK